MTTPTVAETARPSPTQRRVLEWLLCYPGVELSAWPDSWVSWTMTWADEQARQHMVRMAGPLLGHDLSDTAPRVTPIPVRTPRCGKSTFKALQHNGWLKMTRYRPAGKGMSFCGYYTISRAGVLALRGQAG